MYKSALLMAASVMALCAGGASTAAAAPFSGKFNAFQAPRGTRALWNQMSSDAGTAVNSQNYTSGNGSSLNDQGADDFVIPRGKTWKITEIDVAGQYFNGTGPATSENVIFYKNNNGIPGKPVKRGTFNNLAGAYGPNFTLVLPGKGLQLRSGHYWVSVIANMGFYPVGEWGWEVNNLQHGYQAMWQNPPGGIYGICTTWGTIENCVGVGPDLMFEMKGTEK